MPCYCYKCDACGHTGQHLMSVSEMEGAIIECEACKTTMRRDYHAEHAGLAEWSRNKGIFPYVDENLGPDPVVVDSQQHRRRIMKERGLYDRTNSDEARYRVRDKSRRFY